MFTKLINKISSFFEFEFLLVEQRSISRTEVQSRDTEVLPGQNVFFARSKRMSKGRKETYIEYKSYHHFVENISLKKNVVMFKLSMDDI